VISGHISYSRFASSRMACAFSFITPPKRSAPPFCAWVSGAEGSILMPREAHHLLTSDLTVVILLSVSSTLTVMLNCVFRNVVKISSSRMIDHAGWLSLKYRSYVYFE
jgi:hypothetical protein